MKACKANRRTFLKTGLAGAAAGAALTQSSTKSVARTLGANDRINIGLIGCGGRGRYIVKNGLMPTGQNAAVVALCDIWKPRLAGYAGESEKLFGVKPSVYHDYRKLLANPEIDAVIIATADHQHSGMATDAILAGKHVYVEKPIVGLACDLGDLNKLYDTAKKSKVAVQNGTQGVSSDGARAIKKVIEDNTLGKLFRIESTESLPIPYWTHYACPKDESETDWKAFLYNRADRPFDAKMHGKWMGYSEITAGTIGGWMVHFINTVHWLTGAKFPKSAVAWGGRYAPNKDAECTAPDQTMVMLDYDEGFHTQFTTHFGSQIDNETTTFMFEKGCIKCLFGHAPGVPVMSSEGVNDDIPPTPLIEDAGVYPLVQHIQNWLDCARTGKQPIANMDYGYKHGISVVLGDVSWTTGKRAYFDGEKREVRT